MTVVDTMPKNCEVCGTPHNRTTLGAMPYSWGSGPIRWLCAKCSPAAYAKFEAERKAAEDLPGLALELLLNDSEWRTENWTGSESGGHTLECYTCGASYGNMSEDNPKAKHKPDCKRQMFFDLARQLGLLPKRPKRARWPAD